jgi:DNA-binding transcriptional LysR family regulator
MPGDPTTPKRRGARTPPGRSRSDPKAAPLAGPALRGPALVKGKPPAKPAPGSSAKPAAKPARPAGSRRIRPPRLYTYFDAIIRHGSIRRAAEALRIASSALNRRVLDLEQEAGTILFDRLQGGVRLTAAGEAFAAHVRRTLADLDRVGDHIQALQGLMRGQVAIGAAESAAVDFVPQAIAAFQREHPGMRFAVTVGSPQTMLADLLSDRVDLILTHEEPGHHDVAVLAAAPKSFCALMRADHPLAARPRLHLRDCQDFPIVLADDTLAGRSLIEAALATSSLRLQPVLVTNMVEVMKQYVRSSDAICFQFRVGAAGDPTRGDLVANPLSDPELAAARLMLAARRGRVLPPGAAAFCENLRALIAESATL